MPLNDDLDEDLRDALQSMSNHAADQSKLQHERIDQGRAAWQAQLETHR